MKYTHTETHRGKEVHMYADTHTDAHTKENCPGMMAAFT